MSRQFCWKCGTKLLLAAAASVPDTRMSFMDEHVLERISAMEYALSAMNKRVDSLMETVERVAANNFIDHTMIETLTESLESTGINLSNLESDWRKRIDSRMTQNEEIDRLGERMESIIEAYRGSHRKQFMMWMERAYELLASDRPAESLSSLESAFSQDPSNYELGMLLAEVFFQAQEFASAGRRLRQVLDAQPDHFEATLLMGLLEKSHGNLKEAETLLQKAVRLRDDSHSAHASLGSLFMDRGNRKRAMEHFNRALELKPSATTHFMMGALYYQDGRQRQAVKHLKEATQLDPDFGEAFYQLGLACQELNWSRKAKECFQHAQRLRPQQIPEPHGPKTGQAKARPSKACSTGNAISPDQLTDLVTEELHLTTCWDVKRTK
jgi:tetratricopeptide (TPR) repeat protein